MPDWVVWFILAGILAVGEIFSLAFVLGPLAGAAAVAGLLALFGVGILVQLVVFIVAALGSLLLLRPVARRHLQAPMAIRTGTAALVGARAVVVEQVDDQGGRVRIGGEVWSARAMYECDVLMEGARVEVGKIEGATALVYE
jgi:membrane protein implicated in regulation of membrane protease activity